MVGLLGPVPFFCSDAKVFTIKSVRRERASRYAEHAVIGRKPVLEYVGEDSDRVNFTIRFDSNLGIPPDVGLPMLAKIREGAVAKFPLPKRDFHSPSS
ncbi:phage tail protein, partial [Turicimonas muris]|uniref:phage tail protein n=1 Tax=Turicimonas muris TaxID=1796652 RepID=UPI0024952794